MLILRRKVEEAVVIDSRVVVRVLGVSGDTVRLGIDAPADMTVHREEVQRLVDRERGNQEGGE